MSMSGRLSRAVVAGSPVDMFKQILLQRTLTRMGPSGDSAPFTFFSPFADGRQFQLKEQLETGSEEFEDGFGTLLDTMPTLSNMFSMTYTRRHLESYVQMVRRLNRRWIRQSGIPELDLEAGPAFLAGEFAEEELGQVQLDVPYYPSASDIAEVFLGPQDHMILGTGFDSEVGQKYKEYYFPNVNDPHSQLLEPNRKKPQVYLHEDILLERDLAQLVPKTVDGLVYIDLGEDVDSGLFQYQNDVFKKTFQLWPTATYVVTYPIIGNRPFDTIAAAKATGVVNAFHAEFYTQPNPTYSNIHDPDAATREEESFYPSFELEGVGVMVLNPPEQLANDIAGVVEMMELVFAELPPVEEDNYQREYYLPISRVNYFATEEDRVVHRAHDRPTWGHFSHRGTTWTESAASAYAREEVNHMIREHHMEYTPDIDLGKLPDSAFTPEENKFVKENPTMSREEIVKLMDEQVVEQAVFRDQDQWLRRPFRTVNMTQ